MEKTVTFLGKSYVVELTQPDTDYIQKHLAATSEPYEMDLLKHLVAVMDPNKTFVDVGSHIGNHSLAVHAALGSPVIAIEPNKSLVNAMRRSLRKNSWSNKVRVIHSAIGVGEGRGHLDLTDADNLGAATFVPGDGEIQIQPLDSVIHDTSVGLIKIDVEGMEMEVLTGAEKTLARDFPLLYVEVQTVKKFWGINSWLNRHGYAWSAVFGQTPTHFFRPGKLATSESDFLALVEREYRLAKNLSQANHKYRDLSFSVDRVREVARGAEARLVGVVEESGRVREEAARVREEAARVREDLVRREAELVAVGEVRDELRGQVEDLTGRNAELLAETRRLGEVARGAEARLAGVVEESGRVREEAARVREDLVRREAELVAVGRVRDELRGQVEGLTGRNAELLAETRRLGEVARGAEARLAGVVEESGRVREEAARVREDLVRREAELVAVGEVRDELRGQVEDLTARVDQLSKELADVSLRSRQQKEEIERLTSESVELKADLAATQIKYQTVRASKAFSLGKVFEESVKSRRGIIRLIPRLWSEFAKPKFFPRRGPIVTVSLSTTVSHPGTRQHFPVSPLNPPVTKKDLREKSVEEMVVLGIADPFTFGGIQSELNFHQARPSEFKKQLENIKPDFVFVESAWDGQDGSWNRQISTPSSALQDFVELSRERGVPTVFWNKEDPVHFSTFLPAAGLFDYVLTTDIDMVPRYRKILGHDRVNWLPFAVQPSLYNPVDAGKRKDAIIFAGAYYTRYLERAKQIEDFLDQLPAVKKIDVFDRNLHTEDERYRFPERLRHHIVGTLSPGEVPETTRTYRYALNMNSIKQSQTMFARRVVECLASGNIVLSNYARSLTTLLGDLVVSADDGGTLAASLTKFENPLELGLRQLQGIRVAVSRFSYRRQLERLLSLIAEGREPTREPAVHVLSSVGSGEDVDAALRNFECQEWEPKTLTLIATGGFTPDPQGFSTRENVSIVRHASASKSPLPFTVDTNDWVGVMSPDNRYGRHYLSDFMLWREFGDFSGFGKSAVFSLTPDGVTPPVQEESFVTTTTLPTDTSIFAVAQFARDATVADFLAFPKRENPDRKFLATDPFSVVCDGNRFEPEESEPLVSKVLDGVSVLLEGIRPDQMSADHLAEDMEGDAEVSGVAFQANDLFPLFFPKNKKVIERKPEDTLDGAATAIPHRKVKVSVDGDRLVIESTLSDGEHEYLYASTGIQLSGSEAMHDTVKNGEIPVHLSLVGTCAVSGVVRFTDANGNPLQTTVVPANRNETVPIPTGAEAFLLGFRYQGPGQARIERLSLSHHEKTVPRILGKHKVLIVSGAYPAYGNLYRHAFIHTRNKGYRARGLDTDVFRVSNSPFTFSEFEGLPIIDGNVEDLGKVISSNAYSHIAVHLMTPEMWQVLQHVVEQTPVTVWLHGAEIEPYWRRPEIDPTPDRIEASNRKEEFWRKIFANFPEKLHLVFVSNTFARQVFEDYGVTLGENQYSVIPNPIDTELFEYIPKNPEQRYKVLSIRPYASRTYANDLSVAAVLELAKSTDFEKFEFLFVGDGQLWDSTVAPLRRFKNVTLRQGFLTQREISGLHKDYGVFLCPTRHDTQGVSRDEAMSSGLVPISSRISATVEFVVVNEGRLSEPEDFVGIAMEISFLASDPSRFAAMSENSADGVRRSRSLKEVLVREINLLAPARRSLHKETG